MVNASFVSTMLQPAVNISVSPVVTPASAEPEAAIPGDFAALLALDLTGDMPAASDEAAPPAVPVEPVVRQDGKLAGKILPVALPPALPVAADEADGGDETVSAEKEGDPAPDRAADLPAIVLAGVPVLPLVPAPPESLTAAPAQAASAPSRDTQASSPAPAQAVAVALASEEAPAAARPRAARPTPDVPAVRFVQPDAGEEKAKPAPETAKLVEARASARSTADPLPRQAGEASATSGKAAQAVEPLSPALPATVAGDGQSATLVRDLPLQAAPAQSAAVPQAAIRPAPHDFAALVDRLVEARDAAGAHPVSAAIAHGEFGRVSLRFHQDGGALSVAMSSADPGFAPAVAAAAASAQTATSQQQDNASGQQRPEQQAQQQGAANPQAQSHGSAQQASARGGDRAGHPPFDQADDGQPDQPAQTGKSDTHRRGIYA